MTLTIKSDDLLDAEEEYILQQCNCGACKFKPHGLSTAIAKKFPFADPYSLRIRRPMGQRNFAVKEDQPNPGSIQILKDEDFAKKVICMFTQYGMGKPYSFTNKVAQQVAPHGTLAMPFHVGCGLAKGDWQTYKQLINEWAANHPTLHLTMYKK